MAQPPLDRPALLREIALAITDEQLFQNTSVRVREVLLDIVTSSVNILTDGPGAAAPGAGSIQRLTLAQAQAALPVPGATAPGQVVAGLLYLVSGFPGGQTVAVLGLDTGYFASTGYALNPTSQTADAVAVDVRAGTTSALPSGGTGAPFTADIVVSLAGGKSFGKYTNGQTIPARGKTPNQVLLLATSEDIYPTYAPAALAFTQSAPADGEVGESVANTLALAFAQNDAGPLAALRILRNGTQVPNGSGTTSPLSVTLQMVRALAPAGLQGAADYAAGPRKNVAPAGTPDDRAAAVRSGGAPQAAEAGFGSGVLYFTGYYKVFAGPTTGAPTTSAAIRALPGQLTSAGNQGLLNTGTTAQDFVIAPPPGQRLLSVFDLDNQGANITAAYVQQLDVAVADAGGNAVSRPIYLYRAAGPYSASARHQYTYGQ